MNIVEIICLSIIIICIIALILCFIFAYKADISARNFGIIIDAICEYQCNCINKDEKWKVDYDDMKSVDAHLLNLFDWDYTNILPKEKFEIIKPFIMEERK